MLGDAKEQYERFEEDVDAVERSFTQFRRQQTAYGGRVTAQDKAELRRRLTELDGTLDQYLAREYGVDSAKKDVFQEWQASHRPFHWFVHFYGIMASGGFDVIVGNPPYLEAREVQYQTRNYACQETRAIHALCLARIIHDAA